MRNRRTRAALLQFAFVGVLVALVVSAVVIARQNLDAQGITSGFGFLEKSTGWNVNFSLLPASSTDPYWWYFLIGITNTLFLGTIGLVCATVVGMVVGLARTSSNELAALLGRTYVDIFRNIPLILQVFFWYALITRLPTPREAHEAWGMALTNRGLYMPALNVETWAFVAFLVACLLAFVLFVVCSLAEVPKHAARALRTARWAGPLALLAVGVVCLLVGRLGDSPFLDVPALQGLNIRGGLRVPPEFQALTIAIAIYGGSYIAEIVRGGFQSVGRGQVEAARSVGLSGWQTFIYVRLPLAMRAMLPILANQYVWLIKATTLGITVGFTDFFMIVALTINHSGQTIEAIAILMGGFLAINLSIAAIFNRINKAIALKGNQLRG
ncbi:ABC transporter permease subunit [Aureimonas sp. ME7]|uniref:amino acid ABC transporter permease n=1 Tax=Aureimonas sp. ME7 TaxID=2744252 RepID=UPI001FCE6533|nr:ABC transporter permease subunit [Aureimonas sp. ME7]